MTDLATWPIVLFGAPRSGTTYLTTLLNSHPEVYVTNEARVFSWLHAASRRLPEEDRAVKTHRADFVAHLAETLPEVVRSYYRRARPTAHYWGDKNPHYVAGGAAGVLDTVADLYPGARFIHIIRDGRDVVTSLVRRSAPDGTPWVQFTEAGRIWRVHVDNGLAFGSGRTAEDYFELRFEDLVADDLAATKRIFAFLGIDLAPETVEFCEQQQLQRTPVSRSTTTGTIGAPQWRQAMSVEEQLFCLTDLGAHLVSLGYETDETLAALRRDVADLA